MMREISVILNDEPLKAALNSATHTFQPASGEHVHTLPSAGKDAKDTLFV